MEHQLGDRVVYGIHGVCKISEIQQKIVDRKAVDYYVLRPTSQADGVFYVPVGNAVAVAKMRKLLTAPELEALLASDNLEEQWLPAENQRKERYRQIMARGECGQLLGMVRCLNRQKQALAEAGKRLHQCDENFLKDARRLIDGEVSQILGISPGDVGAYLHARLERE